MTHLKIELNNGVIEEVSSAVIDKLYDIVHSGNLDNTSNLIGRLHTSATYQDYIDYLEDTFKVNGVKLLIIDATKAYLMFEDPEVLRILSTTYGDGTGVTLSELSSVSEILLLFKNNTDITKFNEFKYFTSITTPAAYWLSDWFSGCTNLTEITIPKNVRSITLGAFLGCTSLHTVTFDTGSVVESISGFKNCSSLTNIQLPNTVQTIVAGAFLGCSLLSIVSGGNVTKIENLAFSGSGITTVDLSNVTSFGNYAFLTCRQLSSIGSLSTNITTIGNDGFSNCSSLVINNLSLPHLTTLGKSVFFNVGIKQVSNLGLITSIPDSTFYGCTQLTSVTLPLTVTSIGARAFLNCSALTSIDLSNITSIANDAFNGCSSLSSIGTLNNSITSIPNSCFKNCFSLTTFDFSNITYISNDAFNGCTSLGLGQTLELNLTNLTIYPTLLLNRTKYTRLILHSPQLLGTYDGRYPAYANMDLLLYLDLSDWRPAKASSNNSFYGDASFYNNNSLVTFIAPITTNYISTIIGHLGYYSNFRYLILLPTTPPGLDTSDHNNPPSSWFNGKSGNVHIYVPDSAKAAYLADTDWASIGGYNRSDTIADRLHGLSELPAGVWTTGLASLYLTPAQLATS